MADNGQVSPEMLAAWRAYKAKQFDPSAVAQPIPQEPDPSFGQSIANAASQLSMVGPQGGEYPEVSSQDVANLKAPVAFGGHVAGQIAGGALGGMLNPALIAPGAAAGEELVSQGMQAIGLEKPESLTQSGIDVALNTGLNYLMPGAGSARSIIRGSPEIADESTRAALRIAESKGMLKKPAQALTRATPKVMQAAQMAERYASNLPRAIGAELGAYEGSSAVEMALGSRWDRLSQYIPEEIFSKANSVGELSQFATESAATLGKRRKDMAAELTALIAAPTETAMLTGNAVRKAGEKLPGLVYPEEVSALTQSLTDRVGKLSLNRDIMGPVADGINATMRSIVSDVQRLNGATPSDILAMIENLNEYRRSLGEFTSGNLNRMLNGDPLKVMTANNNIGGSIEAIDELQDILGNLLKEKAALISKGRTLTFKPEDFDSITQSYGAVKTLEQLTEKFQRQTSQGLPVRSPTRMAQNFSGDQASPNLLNSGGRTQALWNMASKRFGSVNQEAIDRMGAVLQRDTMPAMHIKDLLYLKANPLPSVATSTALPRSFSEAIKDGAKLSALSQTLRNLGALQTAFGDPREEYMALPRPLQEQMFNQLMQMAPQMFEPAPYGFMSYADGRLQDPMEREAYMSMAKNRKDLSSTRRAEILGAMQSDGTLVPMDANMEQSPLTEYSRPAPQLSDISQIVNGVEVITQGSTETDSMLAQMQSAMSQRDGASSGY